MSTITRAGRGALGFLFTALSLLVSGCGGRASIGVPGASGAGASAGASTSDGSAGRVGVAGAATVAAGSAGSPALGGAAGTAGMPNVALGGAGGTPGAAGAAGAATLDTTPEAVVARIKEAGHERGVQICQCYGPVRPDQLEGCAEAESVQARVLYTPDGARCALEAARSSELLREYLDCQAKALNAYAACEKQACKSPDCILLQCPVSSDLSMSWEMCIAALYCADGSVASGARCNGTQECADGSDEEGCGPGRVQCPGSSFVFPYVEVCARLGGQFCIPDNNPCVLVGDQWHFACGDGSIIDLALACDAKKDCANGRDELGCVRP